LGIVHEIGHVITPEVLLLALKLVLWLIAASLILAILLSQLHIILLVISIYLLQRYHLLTSSGSPMLMLAHALMAFAKCTLVVNVGVIITKVAIEAVSLAGI